MPDYFKEKAHEFAVMHGMSNYQKEALITEFKIVARDQRHACAEAVNGASDIADVGSGEAVRQYCHWHVLRAQPKVGGDEVS